jgi:hypothetical protein
MPRQFKTKQINVPAIVASAGVALAANDDRNSWSIQNVGQNPLFINLGSTASATVFHIVLKGGTADSDGTGGSCSEDGSGTVYTGPITVAGTTPKFVVRES